MPADLIENMVRERLDSALVVRGLVRSRSHGRDLIRRDLSPWTVLSSAARAGP